MQLDVACRAQLSTGLLTVLRATVPSSDSLLLGLLAEGRVDAYSDIDLLWDSSDADFPRAIAELPETLAQVHPTASLRFDPEFQHSAQRRLEFVRFFEIPLFWRVDLDILARSVNRDPDFDRDNPAARGRLVGDRARPDECR